MPGKKLFSVLFLQYGYPWIIAAFAGLILFIVLGLALDYRFLILALIWIFLLVPLVVAFLYFFYAMDPLTAFNSIPHKIIDSGDKIIVRIMPVNHEAEKESVPNSESALTVDKPERDEVHHKDYNIYKKEFKEMKRAGDCVLLFFNRKGWLWFPFDSFGSVSELNLFLNSLKVV